MLPCYTKQIIGVDCPGCGLQRSVAFLFKGDFIAAWDLYPAIFTIIPMLLLLGVDFFYNLKHVHKYVLVLLSASLALILSNYILKFI